MEVNGAEEEEASFGGRGRGRESNVMEGKPEGEEERGRGRKGQGLVSSSERKHLISGRAAGAC